MDSSGVIASYAAYCKDEAIRMASSSGGIFTPLARYILSLGGCVYGAAMDDDMKSAHFIRVTDEKGLEKLRGSKYFQAKPGNIFCQVRDDLEAGKYVLFTGTGCQVNGLVGFLRKDYEKLFCVDIICHGVPSPALWKKYAAFCEKKNHSPLTAANFRAKDGGWLRFGIKTEYRNGKTEFNPLTTDPFMKMFLRNYCLRPSCYECRAKTDKRSDMTIADFWGIDNIAPEMNDDRGTSLIIVRSKKGAELLEGIRDELKIKVTGYEESVRDNPAEFSSVSRPPQRDTFFEDMDKLTFPALEKKYLPISFKQKVKRVIKKTPVGRFLK